MGYLKFSTNAQDGKARTGELKLRHGSIETPELMPVATKAGELLEQALELEEDLIWAEIADQRSREKAKYLSHEIVWKSVK